MPTGSLARTHPVELGLSRQACPHLVSAPAQAHTGGRALRALVSYRIRIAGLATLRCARPLQGIIIYTCSFPVAARGTSTGTRYHGNSY